jgi:hypothetical protein
MAGVKTASCGLCALSINNNVLLRVSRLDDRFRAFGFVLGGAHWLCPSAVSLMQQSGRLRLQRQDCLADAQPQEKSVPVPPVSHLPDVSLDRP